MVLEAQDLLSSLINDPQVELHQHRSCQSKVCAVRPPLSYRSWASHRRQLQAFFGNSDARQEEVYHPDFLDVRPPIFDS